eukprot:6166742-Prorocentrum_lima.AAC.1
MIRRIFETWITETAVRIGTWGPDAQNQWMNVVRQARQQHAEWLDLPPEQQAAVESSYCYGNELPIPQHGTMLES